MGKKFGNLAHVNRIVYYGLSPFEQKTFAGLFKNGVPNLIRRIRSQMFYVVPPFVFTYYLIQWGNSENIKLSRKDPKDYENDE